MNKSPTRFAQALILIAALLQLVSCAEPEPSMQSVEIVCTFEEAPPVYKSPEGIAIGQDGNLFVSLRTLEGSAITKNEIVLLSPAGDMSTIADLGPVQMPGAGVLGLSVDREDHPYVVFAAGDERSGIYKISLTGQLARLPGSERIQNPNALSFDDHGCLYVTDSYPVTPADPGIVWRYLPDGEFEVWATSHLLAPDPVANPVGPPPPAEPFAAPGANGIVFVPPNHLYVANTEKCLILDLPILPNGDAGEIRIVAGAYPPQGPPGLLFAPDGLAADANGRLYTVVPPAGLTGPEFPLSPLLRIDPMTGAIDPIVAPLVAPSPFFDFPTSLAIGLRGKEGEGIFIANMTGRPLGMPAGSGPKITQVRVGVAGHTHP